MDRNLRPRIPRTKNYYAVLAGASPRKRKVYPSPKTTFVIGAEILQKRQIPQTQRENPEEQEHVMNSELQMAVRVNESAERMQVQSISIVPLIVLGPPSKRNLVLASSSATQELRSGGVRIHWFMGISKASMFIF